MKLTKSVNTLLMFGLLLSSSVYAEGEFSQQASMQPEFPSYFTQVYVPQKKSSKTKAQPKAVSHDVKVVVIAKAQEAQLKRAYKGYNVVYAKKAITAKPSHDRIVEVAHKNSASVVLIKPYVKNGKQLYSFYFLRQK